MFNTYPINSLTFEVEDTDKIYKYASEGNIKTNAKKYNYDAVFVMGVHYSTLNDGQNKFNKLLNFEPESCLFQSQLYSNGCMYIFQY